MVGQGLRSRRRVAGLFGGLLLVAMGSAGCGSDDDDAAVDALCADLTVVQASVSSLSGSGEPRTVESLADDLASVRTAAQSVKESAADLSQEVRDELSDAVDTYRQALLAIPSQTPLTDVPEAVEQAGDDLKTAYDDVVAELNCD
jgi:hypothetical protein